jgi:isopentenyldiphosphate isomerase
MAEGAARELVDVVDDDDRIIRTVTRAEMRRDNLQHRAVYVVVTDGGGRLLVHRRTENKDVYPGYFDVTIGGVVGAGETYRGAALREAHEEIGAVATDLDDLGSLRFADAGTRVLGHVFHLVHAGPLSFQPEEIASGGFVSVAEALRITREERCCPDGIAALELWRAWVARRGE